MSDDATLAPEAASTEAQPSSEAVGETVETTTAVVEAPPLPVAEPVVEKLYAGKYKSVEELEQGYRETSAQSSWMANALKERNAPPATNAPIASAPQYTADQLESWKEGRLREVAQHEALASRLQSEGNFTEAQKALQQSQESARQIRMIDKELRSIDIKEAMQAGTRQSAENVLLSQASGVLQSYKADLVEGTPLYAKATEFLQAYGNMGHNTQSAVTQAQAVAMAAQVLGIGAKAVATSTRKEIVANLNQNLRAGVVSAPAKAGKVAADPDFMRMSDKEFAAYKQQRGWD